MKRGVLVTRLRAAAAGFAMLALLIYLNTAQVEDQSEDTLHVAGASSILITRVLAEREAASMHNAWTEYAALVSITCGVLLAVGAPRLIRKRVQ